MGCLLCGKEIGPLRLLRDDEFCSAAHRKHYKDRLGKALSSICAPEPPPAGVAGFRTELQPISGDCAQRPNLSNLDEFAHAIRFRIVCPVAISSVLGGSWKKLSGVRVYSSSPAPSVGSIALPPPCLPNLALAVLRDADPASAANDVPGAASGWVSLPPEPVESFILSAVARQPICACTAVSLGAGLPVVRPLVLGIAAAAPAPAASAVQNWIEPATALELKHTAVPLAPPFAFAVTPDVPAASEEPEVAAPACEQWMPVPAEAVETLVAWSAAAEWMEPAVPQVSYLAELAPLSQLRGRPCGRVAAPAAAPAESWIANSTALELVHAPDLIGPLFALETAADAVFEEAGEPVAVVAAREQFMPAPAAAPVESWIEAAAAFDLAVYASAVAAPQLALGAPRDAVRVVAACERWMPVPADAVMSLVAWSSAGELQPAAASEAPGLQGISISDTFMPAHQLLARPRSAEPAEVHVFPYHRAQSLAPQPALLQGPDPIFDLAPDPASYVAGPRPEPVESMPAQQVLEPAARNIVAITAIRQTGLPEAACSYGYTPARHAPAPVESLVFPTFRATFLATIELALPGLALHDLRPGIMAGTSDTRALPAARTIAAESRRPELEPVRRLALIHPETRPADAALRVPESSFAQLEYYCQRPAGSITRNLELLGRPEVEIELPAFALRPIFDRVDEEAAPQKKASKKLAMAEIFKMPEAKRKAASPAVHYAIKGIAATLLLGAVLWFGAGAMRLGTRTVAVNRDVALIESAAENASDSSAAAASASAPALSRTAPRGESMGAMARVRQVIAKRAAATVTDSFSNGMEAWGTAPKAWASGWSRRPEGYVQPGQLAFFRPSLNYTDYRLEFFGQIDNKSMGWTVRSKDPKNYYAMKFSVVAPGLRPIIAMVHYSVVEGKKSRTTSTPLNVMVHNNTPMQVAVDVRGSRMVTSIDGQEVDTWIDDAIPSGGVGFFAEAGEKSRLYWMKVSKNQDFVGRVCAYLSGALGNGSNASAEVWPPAAPGSAPLPGPSVPGGSREAAVAAAAMGFGSRRKSRGRVLKGRIEPWNS